MDRFTYSYDPVGNRSKIQDLNGSWTTFTYYPNNRLTRDQTTGPNAHDYTYTYDAVDNRLTSTENGYEAFTYDAASRLVTSVSAAGTTSYVYDRNGTQIQVTGPNGTVHTWGTDGEFKQIWQDTNGGSRKTWQYDADSKLQVYDVGAGPVTIVWDGEDYLQERS